MSQKSLPFQPGQSKHHEEAIYSLALIYNIIDDTISSYLQFFNLTPGKFNLLMVVKHHGKEAGIPQVEVSKRLIVTPSNMTKLIDKLEKDHLVTRSALSGDRRVNIVKITAKGANLLDKIWEGYVSHLKELIQGLNQNQQKELSGLLMLWLSKLPR